MWDCYYASYYCIAANIAEQDSSGTLAKELRDVLDRHIDSMPYDEDDCGPPTPEEKTLQRMNRFIHTIELEGV